MTDIDRNKLAVALKYEKQKHSAPVVSAKGQGYMAQQMIALAEHYGIEIRQDKDLAEMLEKLDIDTPIPLEAYAAVAEILSYVYRANELAKRNNP